VDIPEFVPEIAPLARRPIGALEQRTTGNGLEHLEVRRLRLVPAAQEAVDDANAPLGRDDDAGPSLALANNAVDR